MRFARQIRKTMLNTACTLIMEIVKYTSNIVNWGILNRRSDRRIPDSAMNDSRQEQTEKYEIGENYGNLRVRLEFVGLRPTYSRTGRSCHGKVALMRMG